MEDGKACEKDSFQFVPPDAVEWRVGRGTKRTRAAEVEEVGGGGR